MRIFPKRKPYNVNVFMFCPYLMLSLLLHTKKLFYAKKGCSSKILIYG